MESPSISHDEDCGVSTASHSQLDMGTNPAEKRFRARLDQLVAQSSKTDSFIEPASGARKSESAADNIFSHKVDAMLSDAADAAVDYLGGAKEPHRACAFPNSFYDWPGDPVLPLELAQTDAGRNWFCEIAENSHDRGYCTGCAQMDDEQLTSYAHECFEKLNTDMSNQSEKLASHVRETFPKLHPAICSEFVSTMRTRLNKGLGPSSTNSKSALDDRISKLSQLVRESTGTIYYPVELLEALVDETYHSGQQTSTAPASD